MRKNNKNNVYVWKTVKKKKTICRPKRLAQVTPSVPGLSANLGGRLGMLHVAGNINYNNTGLKSENKECSENNGFNQSTNGDVYSIP